MHMILIDFIVFTNIWHPWTLLVALITWTMLCYKQFFLPSALQHLQEKQLQSVKHIAPEGSKTHRCVEFMCFCCRSVRHWTEDKMQRKHLMSGCWLSKALRKPALLSIYAPMHRTHAHFLWELTLMMSRMNVRMVSKGHTCSLKVSRTVGTEISTSAFYHGFISNQRTFSHCLSSINPGVTASIQLPVQVKNTDQ